MNNLEIERHLRSNEITSKHFIGVYPSDQSPKKLMKPGEFLIFNACTANSGGCHWGAVICGVRSVTIMDSSGLQTHLLAEKIYKYISRHKKRVISNRVQIQHENSVLCGKFCLVMVYLKSLKFSTRKILSLFSTHNLKSNDEIVNKLFNQVYT